MTYKVVDGMIETARPPLLEKPDDLKMEREMLLEEIDRAQNEVDRATKELKVIDEKLAALKVVVK